MCKKFLLIIVVFLALLEGNETQLVQEFPQSSAIQEIEEMKEFDGVREVREFQEAQGAKKGEQSQQSHKIQTSQESQELQESPYIQKSDFQKEQSILLSYETKKEKETFFRNQIFPITVKAFIALEDYDEIKTLFGNSASVEVLNKDSKWEQKSDNIYINTFYFKALEENSILPFISVNIMRNSNIIAQDRLEPLSLKIIPLSGDKDFCNVLAQELKISNIKGSRFDEDNNIIIVEIDAVMSNLEDFTLQKAKRDGIDKIVNEYPNQKIYYFGIFPAYQKTFSFKYFNTKDKSYKKIEKIFQIENEDVSTQIELNPQRSDYVFYKNATIIVICVLGIALFAFTRKTIFLLIFAGCGIYLFVYFNPYNEIYIQKGKNIKILPTENSTVFYVTEDKIKVIKLLESNGYTKILFENEKIGWVKNENIIQN